MVHVLAPIGDLSGWVLNSCHLTSRSYCCLDIATNWTSYWPFLWSVNGDPAPLIINWCWRETAFASWLHPSFSAGRVRCAASDDCAPTTNIVKVWASIHMLVVRFLDLVLQFWIFSMWINLEQLTWVLLCLIDTFMRWILILWSSSIDPLGRLRLCRYCLWIWVKEA